MRGSSSGRRCSPTGQSGTGWESFSFRVSGPSPWRSDTAGLYERCFTTRREDLAGGRSYLLANVDTTRVAMAGPLLHELGGKEADTPELIAVVAFADDDLDRLATAGAA